MEFEWDAGKALSNLAKHKVSFDAAMQIFQRPRARPKSEVVDGEVRDTDIGFTDALIVIVVTHTDRSGTVRIIYARKATRRETRFYNDHHS